MVFAPAVVAVGFAAWVEVAASAHAVAAAAVAFSWMKAMLGTGFEAADGARHLHHITRLRKLHGACGGVVALVGCNCAVAVGPAL